MRTWDVLDEKERTMCKCDTLSLKIQYAFICQEHNIIYNHMNENNIRLETSTKEQKEPLS